MQYTGTYRKLQWEAFCESCGDECKELTQGNGIKNDSLDGVLMAWSRTPFPLDSPHGIAYLLPQCESLHCTGSVGGVGVNHLFDQWFEKLEIRKLLFNFQSKCELAPSECTYLTKLLSQHVSDDKDIEFKRIIWHGV